MEIDFSSDGAPEAFFAMGTTGGSRCVTVAGITFELTHQPRLDVLGSQIWSSSILLSEVVATMASPLKFPAMGDVPPAPPRTPSPVYPEPMADSLLVPAPIEISRVLDDTLQSRRKKVIELGAGCTGLSGITMAAVHCCEVRLTEQAQALPILQANVDAFKAAARESAARGRTSPQALAAIEAIHVVELDWRDEAAVGAMAAGEGFDVVLSADNAYALAVHPALRDTIVAAAAPRKGTAVVIADDVEELRDAMIFRAFRTELECALGRIALLAQPRALRASERLLVARWADEARAAAARAALAKRGRAL